MSEHISLDKLDLRDYFAARAMPIIFEFYKSELTGDGEPFDVFEDHDGAVFTPSSEIGTVAELSYLLADAMMKARRVI